MKNPTTAHTRKPELAGIFTIVCGAVEISGSLSCLARPWGRADTYIGLALYGLGLVAVMGGILALGRRVWGLALAGAICALLGSWVAPAMLMRGLPIPGACYSPIWAWVVILGTPLSLLGISAIVLIALSKKEFR